MSMNSLSLLVFLKQALWKWMFLRLHYQQECFPALSTLFAVSNQKDTYISFLMEFNHQSYEPQYQNMSTMPKITQLVNNKAGNKNLEWCTEQNIYFGNIKLMFIFLLYYMLVLSSNNLVISVVQFLELIIRKIKKYIYIFKKGLWCVIWNNAYKNLHLLIYWFPHAYLHHHNAISFFIFYI